MDAEVRSRPWLEVSDRAIRINVDGPSYVSGYVTPISSGRRDGGDVPLTRSNRATPDEETTSCCQASDILRTVVRVYVTQPGHAVTNRTYAPLNKTSDARVPKRTCTEMLMGPLNSSSGAKR